MPVILGGDIRLPDNAKLKVYRKNKKELQKNELITLASVNKNGNSLKISISKIFFLNFLLFYHIHTLFAIFIFVLTK